MPWVDPIALHLYRYLVSQGLMTEWLVYSYILAYREYAHPRKGWTQVPVRHVARLAHVRNQSVRDALKTLEALGAIKSAPINAKLRKQRKIKWYAATNHRIDDHLDDHATAEAKAFQAQREGKRPERKSNAK